MSLIGSIVVNLQAKTDKFEKPLKDTRTKLQKWKDEVSGNIFKGGLALGAGAIAAAAGGLAYLTSQAFANVDAMGKMAANLGTTTSDLMGLEVAAKLGDVELETLEKSLSKLQLGIAEAASTGGGEAFDAFKQLGLGAEELSDMNATDKILAIAGAMTKIDNPATKMAISSKLFGKAGKEMVGWLDQGAEGIQKFIDAGSSLGYVLSDVDAEKINQANDAIDLMGFALKGVGNQIAVAVSPYITQMAKDLLDSGNAGKTAGSLTKTALGWIAKSIAVVLDVLDVFRDGWFLLQAAIDLVVLAAIKGLKAVATGVNWVAEKLGLSAKSAVKFFEDLEAAANDSSKQSWDDFQKNFTERTPGEQLMDWFNNVGNAADNMVAATGKVADGLKQVDEAQAKATKSAEDLLKKWQVQLATMYMNDREQEIYKAQQAGVSDSILSQMRSLNELIKAEEKAKKKGEEWNKKVGEVLDDIQTPMEKYQKKLKELEDMVGVDDISESEFKRAKAKLDEDTLGKDMHFAGAATAGSSEANSIIKQSMFGGNVMSQVAKNTFDVVRNTGDTKKILEKQAQDEPMDL